MQRLTNLCSVLNDMEPICVLNHVFVLREVRCNVNFVYDTVSVEFAITMYLLKLHFLIVLLSIYQLFCCVVFIA